MAAGFLKITVKITKRTELRSLLRGWVALLRNLSWAWAMVGEGLAMYHESIFNSEGATNRFAGQAWAPLAELTVQARLQHARVSGQAPFDYLPASVEGPEGRILHWSHTLRNAMVSKAGTDHSVRTGTALTYTYGVQGLQSAVVAQYGGVSNIGRFVPARPFLDPDGGGAVAVGVLEMLLKHKMGGA